MKKLFAVIVSIGFSLIFSQAYADGTSGCGWGTTLFKGKTGKLNHLLAATTNGSYTQIFGISSGTAGCNPDSQVSIDKKQEVFVASNFENISENMAQGKGEYLAGYAKTFGCSSESVKGFSELTQQNFESIFSENGTATEVIQNTKDILALNPQISGNCTAL